jgi:bacterioferritin (cytochrome b1)
VDFLEVQLGLMDRIGEENWNQLNAKPSDDVE